MVNQAFFFLKMSSLGFNTSSIPLLPSYHTTKLNLQMTFFGQSYIDLTLCVVIQPINPLMGRERFTSLHRYHHHPSINYVRATLHCLFAIPPQSEFLRFMHFTTPPARQICLKKVELYRTVQDKPFVYIKRRMNREAQGQTKKLSPKLPLLLQETIVLTHRFWFSPKNPLVALSSKKDEMHVATKR
jgi:hypothetical protein